MKTEEQVFCDKPCGGALMRDHDISAMEEAMGHRKYTCDKCGNSWKFGIQRDDDLREKIFKAARSLPAGKATQVLYGAMQESKRRRI